MIVDNPELREKMPVFRDRAQAGSALAAMLREYAGPDAVVLAIPAGGVPVAAVIAEELKLPLAVAVVSKITFPWNTEAGFGAVAFDGTIQLNERLVQMVEMNKVAREMQIDKTRRKVRTRVEQFAAIAPIGDLTKKTAILVDDGIASGFTVKVAAAVVGAKGASRVIIAVPTGQHRVLEELAGEVEAVYCANARGGHSFAVANAYENWHDVREDEAIEVLRQIKP